MTSRRRFLAQLAAGVVGLAVAPLCGKNRLSHKPPNDTPFHATELAFAPPLLARDFARDAVMVLPPGPSIRMIQRWEPDHQEFVCRIDVLYGFAVMQPDLAARIASS